MNRLLLLLISILIATTTFAKGTAGIKFDTTTHDFGRISAKGGIVTCQYEFINTGKDALVIIDVTNGGCGCTTPTFTREPIAPGKKGNVTVKFDPKKFKGEFNRSITVSTNAKPARIKLKFSGYITD